MVEGIREAGPRLQACRYVDIRDVNEARTLEAEAKTLEAEARTLEAKAEAKKFWSSKFNKF